MYLRSLLLTAFLSLAVARGMDGSGGALPLIGIPSPPSMPVLYSSFAIGDPDAFRVFRTAEFERAAYPSPGEPLGTFGSQDGAPHALLWGADGTLYSFGWSGAIGRLTLPEDGTAPITSELVAHVGSTAIEATLCRDPAGRLCGVGANGALFRVDPATQAVETVLYFDPTVPGIPNSLICAADGAFYGTSSLLTSHYGLNTHTTPIGPDTPTGSIFRVSPAGELTVLHTFTSADKTIPALLSGLGTAALPGTFPAPTPEHPTKAYLPTSLVQTPAGDLVCWVSGGIFWLPAGGGEPRFLLAPVGIQSIDDPNFYGNYYADTDSIYYPQEFPALHRGPDGRIHGARRSWELTLDGDTVTVAALPVPAKMPSHIVAPNRFISADGGRFMFSGNHRIVFTDDTNTRLAADQRRGFSSTSGSIATVARGEGPRPGFECVYAAVEYRSIHWGLTETDYKLYRVSSSANSAPEARLDDLRGAIATYDAEDGMFEWLFDPMFNDRDVNEEEMTIVAVSMPAHGAVTITADHRLLYRAANPLQRDTFTYTVRDPHGAEDTAPVVVGGRPAVAPDRVAEYETTLPDGRVRFRAKLLDTPADSDGDQLGASVTLAPPVQSAQAVPDDPFSMFIDVASSAVGGVLQYQVADGRTRATGSLRLAGPGNHPPVAEDHTIALPNLQPITVPLSEIASDADGDALTITVSTPPSHGTVTITESAFTFTPAADFGSEDFFALSISDGRSDSPVVARVKVVRPFARYALPHAGYFETDHGSGLVRVTLTSAGRATVQLSLHGKLFRTKLDLAASGISTATFRGPRGENIQLELSIVGVEGRALVGAVTIDGQRSEVDIAPRRGPTADFAGQYNVVLERESDAPMHYGYAVLRLDLLGGARLSGRSPDGRPWSANAILTDETKLAVFAQVAGRTRSLSGVWTLTPDDDIYAVSGSLAWKRGVAEETLSIAGSRYRVPPPGLNAFGDRQTALSLNFSAPGVVTKPVPLTLASGNTVIQSGMMTVRCTVNRANGVFSGYALLHGSPLVSSFTGVLRGSEGFGVLSTKSGPGSVVLLSRDRRTLQLNTGGTVTTGGVSISIGSGNLGGFSFSWQNQQTSTPGSTPPPTPAQ